jgi:hypothetical protein
MIRHQFVRFTILGALLITGAPVTGSQQTQQSKKAPVTAADGKVWLSPTCGCCGKWTDYMQTSGFKLTREVTTDLDASPPRKRVPESLRSCHTALIGGYVIEGHVPADLVRKLLKEQPKIVGIAAPGMPIGSPGMEGPNPQPYSIVAFKADGTTYEFARR